MRKKTILFDAILSILCLGCLLYAVSQPVPAPTSPAASQGGDDVYTLGKLIWYTGREQYPLGAEAFVFHGFQDSSIVIGHWTHLSSGGGSSGSIENMYLPINSTSFRVLDRTYEVVGYNEYEGWIHLRWSG
ncbi:hypothetical protein MUP01_12165 [Candidatus Bathyarchaeota archaeon]|nr:hypothetical protein [Candidatus Bathyarchaeota archaeon]